MSLMGSSTASSWKSRAQTYMPRATRLTAARVLSFFRSVGEFPEFPTVGIYPQARKLRNLLKRRRNADRDSIHVFECSIRFLACIGQSRRLQKSASAPSHDSTSLSACPKHAWLPCLQDERAA